MLPKRNRSIAAPIRRVVIDTPINTVPLLQRWWNYVLVSFGIDGIVIAAGYRIGQLPPLFLNAEYIMLALLIGASIIWKKPLIDEFLRKKTSLYSLKRIRIASYLFLGAVVFPILEIALRAGLAGIIPFIVVAVLLSIGIYSSVRRGKSLLQSHTLAPRNLIVQSYAVHAKNVVFYLSGLLCARSAGILGVVLFSGQILSIDEFVVFELASLLLVLALSPSHGRFFSLCPQCRAPRVCSLIGISSCPSCARKKFYRYTSSLIILCCYMLSGCSSPEVARSNQEITSRSAVIFIPGFKGTILKEKSTGEVVWITAGQAFFDKASLALPSQGLLLGAPVLDLVPDKILTEITLLGGIYTYDSYASTLASLENIYGSTPVIPFAYDWRTDLVQSAQKLSELIESLRAHGVTDITLISHSMGGLIASYYLRYGAQDLETAIENWHGASKVSRVVFAGTPFFGAITICNDIQEGIQTFLNTSLLNSEALSTFPAAYQLMPGPKSTVYLDSTLNPIPGVMHKLDNWELFRWGLFKSTSPQSPDNENRKEITRRLIERAALFSERLIRPAEIENKHKISILNLYGTSHETMTNGIFDLDKKIAIFTENQIKEFPIKLSVLLSDGDLIVPSASSKLPKAYRSLGSIKEYAIDADHGEIISGTMTQKYISDFMLSKTHS